MSELNNKNIEQEVEKTMAHKPDVSVGAFFSDVVVARWDKEQQQKTSWFNFDTGFQPAMVFSFSVISLAITIMFLVQSYNDVADSDGLYDAMIEEYGIADASNDFMDY